jgi:hypothetical protein
LSFIWPTNYKYIKLTNFSLGKVLNSVELIVTVEAAGMDSWARRQICGFKNHTFCDYISLPFY